MVKKIFAAVVLAIAVISFCGQNNSAEAAHIAAYDTATVINVSEYVNLREEPSTYSAVLARVPRGATVEVHAEYIQHNGFYSVIYNGIHGYIHKNYLAVPDWAR